MAREFLDKQNVQKKNWKSTEITSSGKAKAIWPENTNVFPAIAETTAANTPACGV